MNLSKHQKIGLVIGLPILGLVATFFYLALSLDAGKIVQIAAHQVKSATGRALQIRGPVAISLFPRISVSAEQVTLSNPSWAADPDMVSAGRVAMTLRWLPLLHKRIEVDNVTLEKAVVSLQAAPPGQNVAGNWLLESTAPASAPGADDNSFVFDVDQIHLNQVQIDYRDQTQVRSESVAINRLDISASGMQSAVDGAFTLNNLPIVLKGKTTSFSRLMSGVGSAGVPLELDLNLTMAGQAAQMQGSLNLGSSSAPLVDLKIKSQALDLRPLLGPTANAHARQQNRSGRVFSDSPIGFDQWPIWQGNLSLDIAALTLPDGLLLQQLSAKIIADTGTQHPPQDKLTIAPLSFQLGEGRVTATGLVSDMHGTQPAIQVRGYATGFTLGHLMAQLGESKQLSGGPTVMAFHLNSRGATPHAIASRVSGEAQISVGPAVVSSALFNNSGDFLVSVLNAVNPLRKSTDQNDIQCLVAYLPFQNGQMRINQSVGMRSDRLDVTLDGNIDLGAEKLALKIYPQQRSGLTTGVNPAGLVQINGTLMNPSMGINKSGVVKQAAGVGLAIVTGGVSLIAQNAASVVTRSNPCDNVLRPWPQVAGGLAITH